MKIPFTFVVTIALVLAVGWTANTYGYPCNVNGCQVCSFTNFCGLCQNNYVLQINSLSGLPYCQQLNCTTPNCATCYQNNMCTTCSSGFYLGPAGTCLAGTNPVTCSSGCAACSSATNCTICNFGLNLQNGACFSNTGTLTKNCQSGFSGYTCQLCAASYVVNPSYQCVANPGFNCQVDNCAICSNANNQCMTCLTGYFLNGATCSQLTCNINGCSACLDTTHCNTCLTGFQLSTDQTQCLLQVYPCGVQNCVYCKSAGICAQCSPGYSISLQTQTVSGTTTTYSSSCVQITASVGGTVAVTNCQQFGPMIPGTSSLQVGCVNCQAGYVNVGGYCMANLTQANYQCNIANCVYCVQNNICGQCASGYTVYLGSNNMCVPNSSPIPNCLITPIFDPSSTPICSLCASGYALVDSIACVQIPNNNVTCSIANCAYCLTDATCGACASGYNPPNNNTCTPMCTIDNCFICANNAACQVCNQGYYVTSGTCTSAANQTVTYCQNTFGANCQSCSYFACTQCAMGNMVNPKSAQCCPSPANNINNCAQYEVTWQSAANCNVVFTCTACNFGTFLMIPMEGAQPMCAQLPCSIANCSYCFQSSVCILCNQNYNLVNGTCTSYQLPANCSSLANCVACNSSNQCTACLSGYLLLNGNCVCQYQNCLNCISNAFCTQCASPTVATIINSAGCLPPIVPGVLCTVPNCLNCLNVGICAQCDNGFSLQSNGACVQNVCNKGNNCTLCNFNQTVCYVCNPGFIQSTLFGPSCTPVNLNYSCQVSGCALCSSSNPNQCQTCSPYYFINDGACQAYSCIANCIACLSNNTCLVCQAGFYLSTANTCLLNAYFPSAVACPTGQNAIPGCVGCQTNAQSQTICSMCMYGLQPASNGQSCVPQSCSVPNCQVCLGNKMFNNGLQLCMVCQQGYFINSNYQCVSYNPSLTTSNCSGIFNCLYCAANNYCDFCINGWNATNGTCLTSNVNYCSGVANCATCSSPSLCYACAPSYQLSATNNLCTPLCNIVGCTACASLTTCQTCGANFVFNSNNTQCNCPSGFTQTNNTCTCPSGSTISGGGCFQCSSSSVPFCTICNATNSCQTCATNFQLQVNFTCACPAPLALNNNTCSCPSGSTQPSGQSTCVNCVMANCVLCNVADVCSNCSGNLVPINSGANCGCSDNTFTQNGTNCTCNSGLVLNPVMNTCFQCGVTSCQYCNATNACAVCVGNLQVVSAGANCTCPGSTVLYNNFCYSCTPANCITCNATNFCNNCSAGFVVSPGGNCVCPTGTTLSNNTCVACNIANCQLCNTANVCAQCAPSYTPLASPSSCLACNIAYCTSCSSPNFCSACSNSLVPNSQGNLCVACGIGNCNKCLNSYTCAACASGYQLAANGKACYQCTIQGCAVCSATGNCASCLTGYTLASATSCVVCTFPCATCSGSSCLTCLAPYSLNAVNGTCYTCNVANCAVCSQSSLSTCTGCNNNYNLVNGSCVYSGACSTTCANCVLNQYCQMCVSGWTVSPTNNTQCIACNVSNCATCSSSDTTTCLSCVTGYYVVSGSCSPCPFAICQTCNANGCLTFQPNTGLIMVMVENTTYPALCDPGCATCSSVNPVACISCQTGFALSANNLCTPCTYPCLTCAASTPSTCLSCYGNLALNAGTCTTCASQSNCLTCSATNSTQCTSCAIGSYVNSNGVCASGCPTNCIACTSASTCTQCASGFSINPQGVCLPCLSNCRVCSGSAQAFCIQCGTGFYLTAAGTCVSCSSYCTSCNSQGCLKCGTGFYLTSAGTCAPNCVAPCSTCSTTAPSSCTGCLIGYTLNNVTSTCTPLSACPNGVCYACPLGFALSSNTCVQCATGSNCGRCNPAANATCYSCLSGYYLNTSASTCVSCPTGCQTCSNPSNCLSCSSGYGLVSQPVSTSGSCVACQSPCAQCMGSPTTCVACVSGYALSGWNCQSSFNFGFFVSLNTDIQTFYNNYQSFLVALVGSNSNFQTVTLSSIVSGSVNVTGTISTNQASGSNAAGTQFYSLQSTLSQSTIAGMPIITGNVAPNGGTVPPQPTPNPNPPPTPPSGNNNLALILGICIPLGVISKACFIFSNWRDNLLRVRAQVLPEAGRDHRVQVQQHHSARDLRAYQQRLAHPLIIYVLSYAHNIHIYTYTLYCSAPVPLIQIILTLPLQASSLAYFVVLLLLEHPALYCVLYDLLIQLVVALHLVSNLWLQWILAIGVHEDEYEPVHDSLQSHCGRPVLSNQRQAHVPVEVDVGVVNFTQTPQLGSLHRVTVGKA